MHIECDVKPCIASYFTVNQLTVFYHGIFTVFFIVIIHNYNKKIMKNTVNMPWEIPVNWLTIK